MPSTLQDLKGPVVKELFLLVESGYTDGTIALPGAAQGFSPYISFVANADNEAYFGFKVPDDFVSLVSVKAVWNIPAHPAGRAMYWYLDARYGAEGEPPSTHVDGPAMGTTPDGGGGIRNVQEPANPLTLPDLAREDYVGILFFREGSNVLDTIDTSVYLYGLLFTYMAKPRWG